MEEFIFEVANIINTPGYGSHIGNMNYAIWYFIANIGVLLCILWLIGCILGGIYSGVMYGTDYNHFFSLKKTDYDIPTAIVVIGIGTVVFLISIVAHVMIPIILVIFLFVGLLYFIKYLKNRKPKQETSIAKDWRKDARVKDFINGKS